MIRPTWVSQRVPTRRVSSLATRWTEYPKRQVYEVIRKDCPSHYITQPLDARSVSWHIPPIISHHVKKEEFWMSMCGVVGIPTIGAGIIMGGATALIRDPLMFEVISNYFVWFVLPLNLGCATKVLYHSARVGQLRRLQSEAEQELETMRNRRKHSGDKC